MFYFRGFGFLQKLPDLWLYKLLLSFEGVDANVMPGQRKSSLSARKNPERRKKV